MTSDTTTHTGLISRCRRKERTGAEEKLCFASLFVSLVGLGLLLYIVFFVVFLYVWLVGLRLFCLICFVFCL